MPRVKNKRVNSRIKLKPMMKNFILYLSLFVALAMPFVADAQTAGTSTKVQKIVSGTVTDSEGLPVAGATVMVEGTTTGTTTDAKGGYQIKCAEGGVLEFSFIGYETIQKTVGAANIIDVVMSDDAIAMEELVVIAYGTTTRKSAVGAVDQIKATALTERSVANVTQALQGASPSIVIQQRSFNPNGESTNLNIRGIGTMNDNSPLIVIDGLVADGGAFNSLNPQDIENISVLKDAGSAAIYGSRSANGVLLVTTKKGRKNQAPRVQFNAMVGAQDPKVLYTPVDSWVNATLQNVRLANGGEALKFTPEQIRDMYEHGNGTYFLDEILRTALQQNYNASVSGGGENSTYMFSAGYYDQESNFVGPNLGIKRYNLRANLTTEYKRIKLTGLISYRRSESTTSQGQGNAIADASRVPNYYYYRQYDPATGKYLLNDLLGQFNSLGMLKEGGVDKADNDYINLNVGLEYQILDGLKIKGMFGADIYANHSYSRAHQVYFYDSPEATTPRVANADLDSRDWNEKKWLTNTQVLLDYNKTFAKEHTVNAMVGFSNESFSAKSNQVAMKFVDPDLGIKGDATEVVPGSSWLTPESTTQRSIYSVFGRVGYNYKEKYFIEGTFRYDGSSKFGKDYRWGFFPSGSIGWRLSEEDFMDTYRNSVGDIKVRVSYGTLGNQSVGDYQYFTTYDVYSNTYGFNNNPVGGAGFQLGTENLRWEVSRTLNAGLDLTFFRNSLNVTFDYFHKTTSDILVTPQIPSIFGTTLANHNAGKMRTQGWELSVNYNLEHGDFRHGFRFNIGDSWNKVLEYEGFESIHYNDGVSWIRRVGLPLNSYYGLKTDGIFQSYEEIAEAALPAGASVTPGDLRYVDRNGDGVIDGNDRFYLGNAFPRYTFGFNYDFSWKGLEFSIFLQGVGKRDMFVRGEMMEPFHANYYHLIFEHQLDYWTPTNTDAKYPQLTSRSGSQSNNFGTYGLASDLYKLNGAYMRVKNIQVGYTSPQKWTKKIGIEKLRVYVNAQNPFTFSHNSFIDPESSEVGSNMNVGGANSARNYPTLRYYGGGIDLTF